MVKFKVFKLIKLDVCGLLFFQIQACMVTYIEIYKLYTSFLTNGILYSSILSLHDEVMIIRAIVNHRFTADSNSSHLQKAN